MRYEYRPSGVCPSRISFEMEDDVVHNVSFMGGCNGNLQAISRVVDGMTVEKIEEYFRGISCGGRGTSCSDQLAQAVRAVYEQRMHEKAQQETPEEKAQEEGAADE